MKINYPLLVQIISGSVLFLGVIMLVFLNGNTFMMMLIVIGGLGIGLGAIWETMIKEREKKKKDEVQ